MATDLLIKRGYDEPAPNGEHPDFVPGVVTEGEPAPFTPAPDGPIPNVPIPIPPLGPIPFPNPIPPLPPLNICAPVSGRYVLAPRPPVVTPPAGPPLVPLNLFSLTVRVDVDRFFPQERVSIEATRLFPRGTAHAIAEVTSDQCLGFNRRKVTARITYRDGDAGLIPGDTVVFEAARGSGFNYGSFKITLSGAGTTPRTHALVPRSQRFDPVEFEVDRVTDAGAAVTSYDTAAHPNRPADLPAEVLTLATVFQRAGFDVTMSPNVTDIPAADAGANSRWSDAEMHNAMAAYWSRFDNRAQWAMWVLFARQHDQGHGLGGVMFDDIGPNHRQGTAIFTDSFIQDVPPGDPNPAAWRARNVFWTAVHEMGHAFNLAHSWQKALGTPQGAPGDPWVPLANQPEARSFMNYPFNVSGGESAFFSTFRFRFTDDELLFMRHAPRRFVQMGNSDWFVNHGFEAPKALERSGRWALEVRANRAAPAYRFLEPVVVELKLTTATGAAVDGHLLADGKHVTLVVQREGGAPRQWRPMATYCHKVHRDPLPAGGALYGAHALSLSADGWLIDQPGFYKVQAAVDVGDEVVVSNVLRVYVGPPAGPEEVALAPDYFTPEVARALAFRGAPVYERATDVLKEVAARCPQHPAAVHAALALTGPRLTAFKHLDTSGGRGQLAVRSSKPDLAGAAQERFAALTGDAGKCADTLGHIGYFGALDELADALRAGGAEEQARQVLRASVDTMKKRNVRPAVVDAAERKLQGRP